jgi:hypothetical protein
MRRHKIAAVLGTAGLVSASVLITAAPASAATTIENVTFYAAADIGQEVASTYPANDWFFGEVSGDVGSGSFTWQGLEFNGGADGKVQILNQDVETPASAAGLIDLIDSAAVRSTSPAAGDDWTFQLPLFSQGGAGFTTLRPEAVNSTSTDGTWITSGAISDGVTTLYNAGDSASLADLLNAVYADALPTVLAYGFFVNPGAEPVIHAVRWDGAISAFTPVFNPQVTPTTISTTDLVDPAKGLTVSFQGSLPGGVGYVYVEDAEGNEVFFTDDVEVSATGTLSLKINPNLPVGTYSVYVDDDAYAYSFLGLGTTTEITVVAALAATGVDVTIPAGIAIFTLLGGSLALLYARRRTARA